MKITDQELVYILTEATTRFLSRLRAAHRNNDLESFLRNIEMEDLLSEIGKEGIFESFPDGKIVVIGDSQISVGEIHSCFMKFGIQKERVETILEYKKLKGLDLGRYQYKPNYRLMLVGPTPHSGYGKGDYSSIITRMESMDGFPKVIRLSDAHGLKITKSGLIYAIDNQLRDGYII